MNYLIPRNQNENKKTNKKGMAIFITLVIIALSYSALSNYSGKDIINSLENKPNIAVIHVEGTIAAKTEHYNQKWILDTIEDLIKDENNRAIILAIDSPGGGVYEADEVYVELKYYKDKTKRPVYAYFESLAASGGYYIACAADKIWANRNTLTGSIGVIAGQHLDLTDFMEKYGIKSTTITAGRNKNMGNYNNKMTDEQRAIMQGIADECYDQFVEIVASNRRIDKKKIRTLADGRIYTAQQAKANNLIDEIDFWDNAVMAIKQQVVGQQSINLNHLRPENKKSLYKMFMEAITNIETAKIQGIIPLPKSMLESEVSYPAYLYEGFRKN